MKSHTRLAVLAVFIVAIGAGGILGLLLVTRGTTTTESATTILRKSEAAQAQLLAPLGPNTTYHVVTVKHQEHTITDTSGFTAPNDSTTDAFMTFDSAGMLNTFWQVSRGPDGQVFNRGDWSDGILVFTNTKTGKIGPRISYGRFPATAITERLSQVTTKVIQASSAASAAKGMVAGIPAYIIETPGNRTYIGRSDYRVLKSEQLAPDGHVTEYTMQTVQEVSPGIATGAPTTSLQLDMDPATPGLQSVRSVSGLQDINVDIVLGDDVGSLGALDFTLVYDDTRLTPGAAGAGGLAGNPDFNESALGGTWNCGLGGSPSADTDAATGPGHGVALLSCFTTAAGSDIAAATVIATLRLHVAASGTSSITIGNAHFAHYDTTDIGTCDAVAGGTMTCAGGSVTAP